MLWWEFGEIAFRLVELTGLGRLKINCGCERRREALNLKGENLWKRLTPQSASRFLNRFQEAVMLQLELKVTPEKQLHAILHRTGIRICVATMRRWLKALPIKSIPGKEVLYGLPALPYNR